MHNSYIIRQFQSTQHSDDYHRKTFLSREDGNSGIECGGIANVVRFIPLSELPAFSQFLVFSYTASAYTCYRIGFDGLYLGV